MSYADIFPSMCLSKKNIANLIARVRAEVNLSQDSTTTCGNFLKKKMRQLLSRLDRMPENKNECYDLLYVLNDECVKYVSAVINKKYSKKKVRPQSRTQSVSHEAMQRELDIYGNRKNKVDMRPHIITKKGKMGYSQDDSWVKPKTGMFGSLDPGYYDSSPGLASVSDSFNLQSDGYSQGMNEVDMMGYGATSMPSAGHMMPQSPQMMMQQEHRQQMNPYQMGYSQEHGQMNPYQMGYSQGHGQQSQPKLPHTGIETRDSGSQKDLAAQAEMMMRERGYQQSGGGFMQQMGQSQMQQMGQPQMQQMGQLQTQQMQSMGQLQMQQIPQMQPQYSQQSALGQMQFPSNIDMNDPYASILGDGAPMGMNDFGSSMTGIFSELN